MNREARRRQQHNAIRKYKRRQKYGVREITDEDGNITEIINSPPGLSKGQQVAWQDGARVRLT